MNVDPKDAVLSFDALWNAHNRDAILERVGGDAVVELSPAPPPPARARYAGKAEVTEFIDQFLPGFHVESRNFRMEDDEIAWEFTATNDAFRAMGVERFAGTCHLAADGAGNLGEFRIALDAATAERLRGPA